MAAQSGAHLVTSNVDKPSIFELVASHSLDSTFYPALRKIAQVSFYLFTFELHLREICFFISSIYFST